MTYGPSDIDALVTYVGVIAAAGECNGDGRIQGSTERCTLRIALPSYPNFLFTSSYKEHRFQWQFCISNNRIFRLVYQRGTHSVENL